MAAYEAFLKGRHHYYQFSPEHFTSAEQDFTRAIQWIRMGRATRGAWRPVFRDGLLRLASARRDDSACARRGPQGAGTRPVASAGHAVLGSIAGHHDYNWQEADEQFRALRDGRIVPPNVRACHAVLPPVARTIRRGVTRDGEGHRPGSAELLLACAPGVDLAERDRHDEAIAEARKALELDETNYQARMMMALSYTCQGNLALALEAAEEVYPHLGVRCLRRGCWAASCRASARRIVRSRSSRP